MVAQPTLPFTGAQVRRLAATSARFKRSLGLLGIDDTLDVDLPLRIYQGVTTTPGGNRRKLLTTNTKLMKSEGVGVSTRGLNLAPHKLAGAGNMCPGAVPACIGGCVMTNHGHLVGGANAETMQRKAQIAKTIWYSLYRQDFEDQLSLEIERHERYCEVKGFTPALRLNTASDNGWAHVAAAHPRSRFYDYTKDEQRMALFIAGSWPSNYHLTWSYRGPGDLDFLLWLVTEKNASCAVVFRTRAMVDAVVKRGWMGLPCIDGDEHDARFMDAKGVVVALKAKGKAMKADRTGFVVDVEE